MIALTTQVPLDRRQRAAESVRQGLQALVRIGVAEADDLVMIDLPVVSDDAGQRVEVLGRDGDPQPSTDLHPLRRGGAAGDAGHVMVGDRAIQTVLDQRTGEAGALGLPDQLGLPVPHGRRSAGRERLLQQRILEQLSEFDAASGRLTV